MSDKIQSHRDLRVWQQGRSLALEVYRATASFPREERFALTSQLRRCAVSVPSNIAEGYGRGSRLDYARHLKISRGELCELDTQLQIAADLGFLDERSHTALNEDVTVCSKMLTALIGRLEPRSNDSEKA